MWTTSLMGPPDPSAAQRVIVIVDEGDMEPKMTVLVSEAKMTEDTAEFNRFMTDLDSRFGDDPRLIMDEEEARNMIAKLQEALGS